MIHQGTSNAGLKASGSGTTVGTFTDTSFDDAVGSHDGSLTTTTTTVTLKQTTGTASEIGGNFHKPVIFDRSATGDVVALKAANDTELNTIVDRALLKTFANEHPGGVVDLLLVLLVVIGLQHFLMCLLIQEQTAHQLTIAFG